MPRSDPTRPRKSTDGAGDRGRTCLGFRPPGPEPGASPKSATPASSIDLLGLHMTPLSEYMLLSRDERRAHLRLEEACIVRGGDSFQMRGLLAHILDTTIPEPRSGRKVLVCHACNVSQCGNPYHLYWGTAADNVQDGIEAGTHRTPYDHVVAKQGRATADELNIRPASTLSLCGKGNTGKKKTEEHKKRIAEGLRAYHSRK